MTSNTCTICRRSLTNQDSIRRGIGPECEANYKKYLAAAGTDEAEITKLALSNDPTVTRWVSVIGRAIAAGRQRDVNQFLAAARRAYDLAQREPMEVAA
jgi:hypothetical protein